MLGFPSVALLSYTMGGMRKIDSLCICPESRSERNKALQAGGRFSLYQGERYVRAPDAILLSSGNIFPIDDASASCVPSAK